MTVSPALNLALRRGFKFLNRWMILQWRLGLGPVMNLWPRGLGTYLVIAHTGRVTGKRRLTPVNFARADGEIYCVAGFGPLSHWYRNLMANPLAELWLPDGRWSVQAEDVTAPGRVDVLRQVLLNSGFVAPLLGVHPGTMSDDELRRVTAEYRLIHFRRVQPLTGAGGPGDLRGLWLLAGAALLLLLPRRWRRL